MPAASEELTPKRATVRPGVSPAAEELVELAPRPRASMPIVVLCGLAVIGAMYFARDLLIPLVLAVLLALLLRPLLRRMGKLHLPDFASAAILITGVSALLAFGAYKLAGQAQEWLVYAPETVVRVRTMLRSNSGPMGDFQKTKDAVEDLTKSDDGPKTVPVEVSNPELTITVLGFSGHVVASSIIVLVVAFFLLALSDVLLKQAVESRELFYEKKNIVQLVQNVEVGVSRYLLTVTIINIGLGVVTALTMWALRLPNPILWGVMATLLNYVPHVGAFVCMIVLFFVGSVTHESLAWGGLVAGCFAVITFIESYFVTPMTLSKRLQLSPLAVILSVLFWGWLWGIAGGLMAAPLLAVAKIICDQFDVTKPLGVILGEAEPRTHHPPEAPVETEPAQQAA
ncbi:MAG: AI-2E family transporter [Pirellulaceae bacterium]